MQPEYKKFKTKNEAMAFIAGVDLVNDSDVVAIYQGVKYAYHTVRIDTWCDEPIIAPEPPFDMPTPPKTPENTENYGQRMLKKLGF